MKLKELLNVTCINSVIKLEGITSERIKSQLVIINSLNEYGKSNLTVWNETEKKYGDNEVLHQYLENNNLVILIKLV